MWVWVLHRITGIFIIFYGISHLLEIMVSHFGPGIYNLIFGWGYTWWMQTLDILLVAALLYHSMNGLRVILLDMGIGVRKHKLVFTATMLLALATFSLFVVDVLPYILGKPIL